MALVLIDNKEQHFLFLFRALSIVANRNMLY